jgi:hypothetical protein
MIFGETMAEGFVVPRIDFGDDGLRPEDRGEDEKQRRGQGSAPATAEPSRDEVENGRHQRAREGREQVDSVGHVAHGDERKQARQQAVERIAGRVGDAHAEGHQLHLQRVVKDRRNGGGQGPHVGGDGNDEGESRDRQITICKGKIAGVGSERSGTVGHRSPNALRSRRRAPFALAGDEL